ncbi:hypothetical protein [Streptomyces sp. Wb2n-11]|uniref:hypothetical protein n=1 Tax=Streptomyces sp. Wb2n-11 TaxID=1030533 RepID=UPI000AC469D0|nr:hypothetical protein [Streptomyces sp. Wb2n-11]
MNDWYTAGCARACTINHTRKPGECFYARTTDPEPCLTVLRTESASDGGMSIVGVTYTLTELATLLEVAMREVGLTLSPTSLAALKAGNRMDLPGAEYQALALTAARSLIKPDNPTGGPNA